MQKNNTEVCKLDKGSIAEVTRLADGKLGEYGKTYDILGEYIFTILGLNCHVLLYPLADKQIWGFLERIHGKNFICINSSLEREKQVFVAAHELYHLWFSHESELITRENLEERFCESISLNEMKANRFAAQFLIPETLLCKEIKIQSLSPNNLGIKEILLLANSFIVPYRTMVKRLHEIGIFTLPQTAGYLDVPDDLVTVWRNRLGFNNKGNEGVTKFSTLVDQAMSAYERKLITRERLEYLISFSGVDEASIGLEPPPPILVPSEEDIHELMEDDD